jgi:hypothetical protein
MLPSFMLVSCSGWVFHRGLFILSFHSMVLYFLVIHYCGAFAELQGVCLMTFGAAE